MSGELPVEELQRTVINDGVRDANLPLFALVIGIDNYSNHRKLSGAVADADAVCTYLRRQLNVPETHISNLRNEQATRKAIIEAFKALGKNPHINRDDAIFIYFAGHGAEQEAPQGWDTGGEKTQVILPQDTDQITFTHQPIHSIPDRTIAALLDSLADKKGNNITVVFDCCHATSGPREDRNVPGRVSRVSDVQHPLFPDVDNDIIPRPGQQRQRKISCGFSQRGLGSHVLLAACDAKESAWETCRRGAFTTALLDTLTASGVDDVTFTGIIEMLPSLPKQHPRCEGFNLNRVLFTTKVQDTVPSLLTIVQQGGAYTVSAEGIIVGSEFDVYNDREPSFKPPLCTLRVNSTETSRATLEPLDNARPYTLPKHAYARQVRRGPGNELRVHFTKALGNVVDVKQVRPDNADSGFVVTKEDQAELVVDVDNGADGSKVVFSTTNSSATAYGNARLPHLVPPEAEAISRVLRSAARWNRHLNCTNTQNPRINRMVDLEFYRLEQVNGDSDHQGIPILEPMGEDMNRTGVVQIVVNPDDFFGFKIVNRGARPLYPHLFYFDISDQSIGSYYLPPSSGKSPVDPPLRPLSHLTIGYGATGGVPLAFELRGSAKVDVGFLKLFLTTTQTDFGPLAQESPFGNTQRHSQKKQESPFSSTQRHLLKNDVLKKLQAMELWGTAMVTIIQRAEPL